MVVPQSVMTKHQNRLNQAKDYKDKESEVSSPSKKDDNSMMGGGTTAGSSNGFKRQFSQIANVDKWKEFTYDRRSL